MKKMAWLDDSGIAFVRFRIRPNHQPHHRPAD